MHLYVLLTIGHQYCMNKTLHSIMRQNKKIINYGVSFNIDNIRNGNTVIFTYMCREIEIYNCISDTQLNKIINNMGSR